MIVRITMRMPFCVHSCYAAEKCINHKRHRAMHTQLCPYIRIPPTMPALDHKFINTIMNDQIKRLRLPAGPPGSFESPRLLMSKKSPKVTLLFEPAPGPKVRTEVLERVLCLLDRLLCRRAVRALRGVNSTRTAGVPVSVWMVRF